MSCHLLTPFHPPPPPSPMAAILKLAFKRYKSSLQQRPLLTKAATSATIAALSDVIAQTLTPAAPYSARRTLLLALLGFLWGGPSVHFWQKFMEKSLPGVSPGQVLKKTLVD